jgi:hypothetical protein
MFFFLHPRSTVDRRPKPELVIKHTATITPNTEYLVIDKKGACHSRQAPAELAAAASTAEHDLGPADIAKK